MDIDAAYYAAVGRVASTWAELEFNIDQTIWTLAEVDQMPGACITAQLPSIHARLRALKSLVRLRGGSEAIIRKINKFSDACQPLARKRSRMVHDPLMVGMKTGIVYRLEVSADSKLQFGFQPTTTEEVNKVYKDIVKHAKRFYILRNQILSELSSLPGKPPGQLLEVVPVRPIDESQNPDT